MRARLLRSAPMRQALGVVAVVALVNLLSLGAAWLTLRAEAEQTINDDLARDVASFDVAATPSALRTLVQARARVTDPAQTVYVFLGNDGGNTGNARAVVDGFDVGFTALAQDRDLSETGYVENLSRLSGGVLIVAKSLDPVARLDEIFLVLVGFSTLPTVLIALAIGALIARRSARRVNRIEGVLERIAKGDLAARTAESGAGDDLSRIGAGVNRMAEKQEVATDTLRQVTTDIAHDLRTPLQRIGVTLEEMQDILPEGRARHLADEAQAEANRAVSVFRALLEIAQIEGGRARDRFEEVDLADVASQIVELYAPAAEEEGGQIVLDLPAKPALVKGDRDLIGQALANLVENAMRHAPDSTEITVSVGPKQLVVADHGPGIPRGERDKVLRRLYRLERSRTTPGNGLGLALVAAVAETHGAKLTLGDNAPGLTVTLDFP